MIYSLLDTDFYKLTMMQFIWHHFPKETAEYTFQCRNQKAKLAPIVPILQQYVHQFLQLSFQLEEIEYLRSLGIFKEDFLSYLINFRFVSTQVSIVKSTDTLSISIHGLWVEATLLEVPLLAMINQLYYEKTVPNYNSYLKNGRRRLQDKISILKNNTTPISFINFGSRRRFTHEWHMEIDKTLNREIPSQFIGTSNLYSGWKHSLCPKGTMAHELFQAAQVLSPQFENFQRFILHAWKAEFPSHASFALTDTIGIKAFLTDFSYELSTRYEGVRHDSGSPFEFIDRMIQHYKYYGIDAREKTLIFSDHITIPLATEILAYIKNRTRVVFGIGTYLTNDVGLPPLEIVIKLTRLNQQPVAKLSDSPKKNICLDPSFLRVIMELKTKKEHEYKVKLDQN